MNGNYCAVAIYSFEVGNNDRMRRRLKCGIDSQNHGTAELLALFSA